uniref:AAA family ATPase n=1 Tax=uncultured Acinetobacter sp. TaxID=165433 RepID=UPI0026318032|nr:AAA family ATPase [uncultured Acinetobacter sp.]
MISVQADYKKTGIRRYDDNPFIEALPPILEPEDVISALSSQVDFCESDKNATATMRSHMLVGLMNNFFQPIARHVQLENRLSLMLREGYVARNIENGNLAQKLQEGYQQVKAGELSTFRYQENESTATSLAFIGCSGSGKTTTINRILGTYPQSIYHSQHNFTQIVYLKIDCPHDGSLKSLCLHFFRAIDKVLNTNYEKKYGQKRHSVETLLPIMAQLANFHAIGLLIIDEIQHLSIGKSGGAEKMLNFFVTLVNTINLPIIMIGTPKARFIFEGDFRSARRGAGLGSIFWEQMKAEDNIVTSDARIIKSEWNAFTDKLWKYQWLKKADITLSDEIRSKWYELSQGILDIVLKLFVLSQFRAIESGIERITVKVLEKTYQEDLKPIHPMIKALQSGIANEIAQYSDLVIPDIDHKVLILQEKITIKYSEVDDEAAYQGHEASIRLHRLLKGVGYDSTLLPNIVTQIFNDFPNLDSRQALTTAMQLLAEDEKNLFSESTKNQKPNLAQPRKAKSLTIKDWHTLDSEDLRFQFSQKSDDQSFYAHLKQNTSLIFDFEAFLKAS